MVCLPGHLQALHSAQHPRGMSATLLPPLPPCLPVPLPPAAPPPSPLRPEAARCSDLHLGPRGSAGGSVRPAAGGHITSTSASVSKPSSVVVVASSVHCGLCSSVLGASSELPARLGCGPRVACGLQLQPRSQLHAVLQRAASSEELRALCWNASDKELRAPLCAARPATGDAGPLTTGE